MREPSPRPTIEVTPLPPERGRRAITAPGMGCCSCSCSCCLHVVGGIVGMVLAATPKARRTDARQVAIHRFCIAYVIAGLLGLCLLYGLDDMRHLHDTEWIFWLTVTISALPLPAAIGAGIVCFVVSKPDEWFPACREVGRLLLGAILGTMLGLWVMWMALEVVL